MTSIRRNFIRTTTLATAAFGVFPIILKAGSPFYLVYCMYISNLEEVETVS